MKRKLIMTITIGFLLFGLSWTSHASLVTIGTATYLGNNYNLIYDADAPWAPLLGLILQITILIARHIIMPGQTDLIQRV